MWHRQEWLCHLTFSAASLAADELGRIIVTLTLAHVASGPKGPSHPAMTSNLKVGPSTKQIQI